MKAACGWVLLLRLLSVCACDGLKVVGRRGEDVTLPCTYDVKRHGRLAACWGRGEIPASGCGDEIIATDGSKATEGTGTSGRYRLRGGLDAGDVSLTVLNASEGDSGLYGCRVQIPGWFNDEKHSVLLSVVPAPESTTSTTSDATTSTQSATTNQTRADRNDSTASWVTSAPSSSRTNEVNLLVFLVCFLFVCVVLVTVGGVFIIARRWSRLNKSLQTPNQQQTVTPVHLNSVSSSRCPAVENIYQMEEGVSEYESCP